MKPAPDKLFVNVDKTAPIKDTFKMMAGNIAGYEALKAGGLTIGDIGRANGVFRNYLKSVFSDCEVIGFEYQDELFEFAKNHFPNDTIRKLELTDHSSVPEHSLDIITVSGVLSFFDNIEPIIHNLLKWVKLGGRILVMNGFNPYDIDVFVKYRHAGNPASAERVDGWNIISQATVSNILRDQGVEDFSFTEFEISVDIEPRKDDALRSWTEKTEDGKRLIFNGLNLKRPIYLLEINV